ncbi:MAG: hypothetical protein HWD59_13705 [Coxiellaceae bacterium]|nr:MAG: hypothetical protein HWD59_13705 [Coxiellaceae bacterium]
MQDELQKQLLRIEKIATDLFKINKRMDSMDLFNKTLNSTEESPSWMKLEQ